MRLQELETSKGGGGGRDSLSSSDALTDDLRREITLLKSRIEGLEKELMNQEAELKAAKVSLKDKNNDPMIKNLSSLFQQFSLHLTDLQSVQKEMDKLFLLHKTTWDLKNLQTKLNLIENHQNLFSEEIYNSIHKRRDTIQVEKDSNNNSTISTKAKPKIDKHTSKLNETSESTKSVAAAAVATPIAVKEKKSVKITDPKSDLSQQVHGSATNTLKRKRESKSPLKIADSPSLEELSKKQQSGSGNGNGSNTTATILVSKTKTKSGLPLLLKKWRVFL
jgi:hypothetical protein